MARLLMCGGSFLSSTPASTMCMPSLSCTVYPTWLQIESACGAIENLQGGVEPLDQGPHHEAVCFVYDLQQHRKMC